MSHFRLHTNTKGREYLKYLMLGFLCLMASAAVGYGIHRIGQARARSQETVLIYTVEEVAQYLVDQESGEYNLNGRYQLEENLDLRELNHSIGTNIEPFTGKLDGNGHVIRGLTRPLFGVMKEATVENLFLSEAEILYPFTYYDGEHYVDGYGALAAYAVDSVIRNCGMGGGIYMASPVEAEYQVAKASPAEALEEKGPGETEAVTDGDIAGENGSGNGGSGGPGMEPGTDEGTETESETAGGPGVETETEKDQGTSGDAGTESGGPGDSVSEFETSAGTETEPGTSGGTGTDSGTAGGSGTESGAGEEPGSEPETTGSQAAESGGSIDGIEGMETKGETEAGVESGTDGKSETDQEVNSGTGMESGTNTEQEEGSGMETGSDHGVNGNQGSGQAAGETDNGASNTEENLQTDGDARAETVGYQPNERQHLMMKVSTAPEIGPGVEEETEPVPVASPSDATPSDADHPVSSTEVDQEESLFPDGPEEPESTGSPQGEHCILVIADRIKAGGLVAETAGNTLISDSFVLVNVGGGVKHVDSRAGGFVGILGENTRTENSYASGFMEYPGVAGGFAAVNRGDVQNCYSTVTVGMDGTARGAFVVENTGTVTDCVYDRQMASVAEKMEAAAWVETYGEASRANAEPGSGVTGLEIAEMTGLEAQVPGNWYLAEQAYPQIEYFAGSGDETISSYSKASVISLPLPSGVTLLELQRGSDIQLPSEVDGLTIQWDAKGEAVIDENNQVKIDRGEISISPNQVPVVEAALEPGAGQEQEQTTVEGEETSAAESAATENVATENAVTEKAATEGTVSTEKIVPEESTAVETTTSSGIVLEATVGTATRTILGNTGAVMATAAYANWGELGNAIYASQRPAGDGSASNPFLLGTPENLAWFMVHVNNNNFSACAKLTADIDLSGKNYGYTEAAPMPWTVMALGSHGNLAGSYSGTFDGDFHTISSVYCSGTAPQMGFIGVLSGTVQNLYLDKINYKSTLPSHHYACVGGIAAQTVTGAVIQRCGVLSGKIVAEQDNGTMFLAVAGIVGDVRGQTIRDCFNRADIHNAQTTSTNGHMAGGIGGRSANVTNCYSTGKITSINASIDGIALTGTIKNAYVEEGTTTTTKGKALSKADLQSWTTCYALNSQNKEGPWKYNPGGYPDFGHPDNPHTGSLPAVEDWSHIGKGLELGVLTNGVLSSSETGAADNPYHISTAEQLAQFAYKVNHGAPGLCAELTADINLSGTAYTGNSYDQSALNAAGNALKWIPIGQDTNGTTDANVYTGFFQGKEHIISQLHAAGEGKQGLFGTVKGGYISGTGIESCYITGLEAGGIAGRLDESAMVSRCFNRQKSFLSSLSRDNAAVGGIAGQLIGSGARIEDCYNLDNTITGNGSGTFIGGIAGKMEAFTVIQNSYSAMGTVQATGNGGAVAGSIAGAVDSTGLIRQCYREKALSGDGASAGISDMKVLDDTTKQQEVDGLNTLTETNGLRERIGDERAWYTSLVVENTYGLPTLKAPAKMNITLPLAESEAGSTVSLPSTISNARFRGLRQETGSDDQTYELTSKTDMSSNFYTYGTDNASKKLGLVTGAGTDFYGLTPSMMNPTASLGTMNSLVLYTGGAYTCAKNRVFLLDVESGNERYEIRATVPAATSKTINVVLPVKVVMKDLVPDGTEKRTISPDLELRNTSKYPIEGKILGVTSKTGTGYVTLKPVAKDDPYGDTKQLTDPLGGVKLGIEDGGGGIIPAGDLYYTPAKESVEETWMNYKLKGQGVLPYRYFIEYAGSHYPADNQYEYTVTYQFSMSKDDMPTSADAVVQ